MERSRILTILLLLVTTARAWGEPEPGDVFREYNMSTTMWRVGERAEWGGSNWGKNLTFAAGRDEKAEPFQVDLDQAERAEVCVGYDQCHASTRGLAIAFNDNDYLRLPVSQTLPVPRSGYMTWPYPTVGVPLAHLKAGANQIKFRIDPEPRAPGQGGWQQNLVYSVVLRVYYKPTKPHPQATLTGVEDKGAVGLQTQLGVNITSDPQQVQRVEYVGWYLDFDHDSDGIFREWQYRYQDFGEPALHGHIGTSTQAPFSLTWDTRWIPDQVEPMHIAARVVGVDGVTLMTREARALSLVRPGYSVEMCVPYNVPQGWVTRKGRMGQKFRVSGDLSKAREARVVFRSWGGNDGKGGWINNKPFPRFRQPGFDIDLSLLQAGENTLETDKGGHHGLEVAWPGAVVFIRYENQPATGEQP